MEILEHKNGRRIGEISNEEVRGLIIFQYNKNNDIYGDLLLLKNGADRSTRNPDINSKLEIVGGRRALEAVLNGYKKDAQSEDILRGILREVEEETGLRGENIQFCEPLTKITTNYNTQEVISHIFKIVVDKRFEPKLTKKHVGHQWLSLDNGLYEYDSEKKDYILKPECIITPRAHAILESLKYNYKIKMYLSKKIGQYSPLPG